MHGGGPWRAGHGEQGRTAGGRGGGGAPASRDGGELAEKLHRGARKVSGGSVGGKVGRGRGFRGGRRFCPLRRVWTAEGAARPGVEASLRGGEARCALGLGRKQP